MNSARLSLVAVLLTGASCATTGPRSERVLIHMKIGMNHDDNPACVAFNVAWAALEAGRPVDILYDAGAVFDLQIPGDEPKTGPASAPATQPASRPASQPASRPASRPADHPKDMPYSLRYPLPDKLKAILAEQFEVPAAQLPATYFDYLKMLSARGASVYVNGSMAHLVSLSDSVRGRERITSIAKPITFREMLDLRAAAGTYFVY